MSDYWFSVSGDAVTLHTPGGGTRTHTEEALISMDWTSLGHFASYLRSDERFEDRSPTIEDYELIALQTRPQHVSGVIHDSDCSRHNAPALPAGNCDCSAAGESRRAPLPGYGQRTPYDPFGPGFTVSSDCAVEAQPSGTFGGLRLDGCTEFRAPRAL